MEARGRAAMATVRSCPRRRRCPHRGRDAARRPASLAAPRWRRRPRTRRRTRGGRGPAMVRGGLRGVLPRAPPRPAPAARGLAVAQRAWLESGALPGGGGPWEEMVSGALLDLHVLDGATFTSARSRNRGGGGGVDPAVAARVARGTPRTWRSRSRARGTARTPSRCSNSSSPSSARTGRSPHGRWRPAGRSGRAARPARRRRYVLWATRLVDAAVPGDAGRLDPPRHPRDRPTSWRRRRTGCPRRRRTRGSSPRSG